MTVSGNTSTGRRALLAVFWAQIALFALLVAWVTIEPIRDWAGRIFPVLLVVFLVLGVALLVLAIRWKARGSPRTFWIVAAASATGAALAIVLHNLLMNAINYSPEGGRILVRIADRGADHLEISVIDEGIGIAQEHMERVFEPFYRVDVSDSRQVYGRGLGLYVSKRLIELQGGRIWVKSKFGQGSCFTFTLPIVQESAIAPESLHAEVVDL